jgi:DNA-binding transcriptional ArsR family regulator
VGELTKRDAAGLELLADPTRRRIVAALAVRPRKLSSIASELGLRGPATTRQLRLLAEAGLIRATRSPIDGRSTLYVIESRRLGPITAWLAATAVGRPMRDPTDPDDGSN